MKLSQLLTALAVMSLTAFASAAEGDTVAASFLTDFTFDTSTIIAFIGIIFAACVSVGMTWMSIPMVTKGMKAVRSSFG